MTQEYIGTKPKSRPASRLFFASLTPKPGKTAPVAVL